MPKGRSQLGGKQLVRQTKRNTWTVAPTISANRLSRQARSKVPSHIRAPNPNRRPVIRTGAVSFRVRRSVKVRNPLAGTTIKIMTPFTKRVVLPGAARIRSVKGTPPRGARTAVVTGASNIRRGRRQIARGYPIAGAYNIAKGKRTISRAGFRTSILRRNTYVMKRRRYRRDSRGRYAGSY